MLYKHIHKDRINSLMTISAAVIIAARLNATNWNNAKNTSKIFNCNYKGKKKQEEASQNHSTAVLLISCLQHSSSQLIQLLLLLLFPFLFTQISVGFSSLGVPKGPPHIPLAEPLAPPGRDQVSGVFCKGTMVLGGGGGLRGVSKKYN